MEITARLLLEVTNLMAEAASHASSPRLVARSSVGAVRIADREDGGLAYEHKLCAVYAGVAVEAAQDDCIAVDSAEKAGRNRDVD